MVDTWHLIFHTLYLILKNSRNNYILKRHVPFNSLLNEGNRITLLHWNGILIDLMLTYIFCYTDHYYTSLYSKTV